MFKLYSFALVLLIFMGYVKVFLLVLLQSCSSDKLFARYHLQKVSGQLSAQRSDDIRY